MARPEAIIIANIVDRVAVSVTGNVFDTLGLALEEFANSRTSKQLVSFADQVKTEFGQARALEANEKLAASMRTATRRSWGQAKHKLRPAVYNPTRDKRFSGGMQKIMDSDYLAVATARGVEFGPVALMDRDAAQWARLNFGAGHRGQGSSERFPVRFSNLPTLEFVFEEPARPGYGLPVGGFKGPDGRWQGKGQGIPTGAFYPKTGAKQEFPTEGNVGFYFLDAGIRAFFRDLPVVYGELFDAVLPGRRGRRPAPFERRTVSSARR